MPDSVPTPAAPRRRIWPWVLGFCLTPFVVVAAVAISFLTLDRGARALRHEVMAASDGAWHTKIQLSVGPLTIDALRTVLVFVHGRDVADARLALRSVSDASVGVYELAERGADFSAERLLTGADETMHRRGWVRLVGVVDGRRTVLVYTTEKPADRESLDFCVAVVDGRRLVVVSTTVNAAGLAELVEQHAGNDWKHSLHLARF